MVARWVSAFRTGWNVARTGRLSFCDQQMELVRGLLAVEHRWTVRELAIKVGLGHQTVRHILLEARGFQMLHQCLMQ
ncbi:hypothetical protein ANN_07352 [Periplaneta americana]|uniref:Uncharacterized protein n=1 Tax=Periplaneta americana TaxID=6978 RepID=A0ABQ8T002_PERAM|nr:hypothetical protein ANN_07352 [Periplaneta americana]